MGINFPSVAEITFGLSSVVAAVCGVLFASANFFFPSLGLDFTVKSFTVIVLGGMGNIVGAFVGGIVLGITESVTSLYLTQAFQNVAAFVVLIVVLVLKPSGLFGKELR